MNKFILNSYLDGLWDDYRIAHCRSCQRETEYWETATTIKKANAEFNLLMIAQLIHLEYLLSKYQYTNNDVATALEISERIRRELNE